MTHAAKPIELNSRNFQEQVLNRDDIILVDIWAPWCGPCRVIAPIMEALAVEFEGRARIGKLNIDDNSDIGTRYGVQAIPTLLLFKGGVLMERIIGLTPKAALAEKLNHLLNEGASVAETTA